jgi:DNA-binding LacI/PurR family transcriptional regulator
VTTPGNQPQGRRRRPTVRDVARAAGVSVAVVSYTFNRPERVASATRERVLAAAHAIGYRGPDPAARALRLGRHGAIALVVPDSVERLFSQPAYALVGRGLARACDQAGISLVLSGGNAVGVDGAVLLGGAAASWTGSAPAVIVGDLDSQVDGIPIVRADVARGAADLGRHLAEQGHRRLAVITWPGGGERLAGLRAGWGDVGPVHAYEVPGTSSAAGEAAARTALQETPRPDAIVALCDELARGALDAASFLGLSVPRDVSIAGIDDLPGVDVLGLTSVFIPYRPMGDLAGAILAAGIDGATPASPPPLPTSLTLRSSTAPRA